MSHALPSTILSLHDVGSASTLREEIDQLEMKLPRLSSLAIIIICNALMQVRFINACFCGLMLTVSHARYRSSALLPPVMLIHTISGDHPRSLV
jgi:hypothetical protein